MQQDVLLHDKAVQRRKECDHLAAGTCHLLLLSDTQRKADAKVDTEE